MKKRLETYRELIAYLFAGVSTTMVSLAVYYVLTRTVWNPKDVLQLQMANVVSWICAVLYAYVVNRKFVFQSDSKQVGKELTMFIGTRISTLLVDMGVMYVLVVLWHMLDGYAKVSSQVLVIVLNYVLGKVFVFRKGERVQ